MVFIEALSRVLPVILLLLLGLFLHRWQFLRPETISELKKFVVNLTLPAVLFLAFSQVDLESRHLVIVVIMFATCILALLLARAFQPVTRIASPYFPMLMTGFEAGMLGYAIFSSVYGSENVFKFGVVDLGQVVFVFFVLVPVLERVTIGARPFSQTALNFFKTPVILAILTGILYNRLGLQPLLASWPLSNSVLAALGLLAGLTTPLVALIIGYEMQLVPGRLFRPLAVIGFRLLFWVPAGLFISILVVGRWLRLDPVYQAAVMTMVILPPPFVIPLFMTGSSEEEQTFVVNSLSIATLVTLFAFALVSLVYPPE